MVHTESARLMTIEDLIDVMDDEEYSNPTVDRMFFIETRKKGDKPGRLFPIVLEGYTYEDVNPVKAASSRMIRAVVIQSGKGEVAALRVVIRESELGENKRIWDKPPTKGLRDDTKWPGEEDKIN